MAVNSPSETFKNPVACASAFGRIFYAVGNRVYFSWVFQSTKDLGRCYQVNDPVSEDISDVLATDGGTIKLDEAINITSLLPYRSGMLVFADNGVWYMYNPDGGFTATDYNVAKITSYGIESPRSVVEAEGSVFYFSRSGIIEITAAELDNLAATDITQQTIASYYFDNFRGKNASAIYDQNNRRVLWVNPDISPRWLELDLTAKAFYPMKTEASVFLSKPVKTPDQLYYAYYKQITNDIDYGLATESSEDFKDFGVDSKAYLITGYETLGRFSNKKSATRAKFYFNRTETQITGYTDGAYTFDKPSSCLLQTRWDFDSSDAYKKWVGSTPTFGGVGREVQVYHPMQRGFIPDSYPYTLNTGESLLSYTHTVRGSGDAVQFVFEAEPEKDLQLLGYTITYQMRGRP